MYSHKLLWIASWLGVSLLILFSAVVVVILGLLCAVTISVSSNVQQYLYNIWKISFSCSHADNGFKIFLPPLPHRSLCHKVNDLIKNVTFRTMCLLSANCLLVNFLFNCHLLQQEEASLMRDEGCYYLRI